MIRGARQLLTLRGSSSVRRGSALNELNIIEDGSILIRNHKILAVGPTRRIENLNESRDALTVPAHGKVVMPGFVDASVSLESNDAESRPSRTKQRRRGDTSRTDPSMTVLRSCLQHGTALVEVKTRSDISKPVALVAAFRGISRITNNPVDVIPTWRLLLSEPANDQTTQRFQLILQRLIRDKLLRFVEIQCSDEYADAVNAIADILSTTNVGLKLHWTSQCGDRLAECVARLKPLVIGTGAELDERYIPALASAQSIVAIAADHEVLSGAATLSFARKLIDAGSAVALTTGYHPSRPTSISMQMAIALAVIRLGMTVEESITAATINAAHAAGCGHLTGSLEVGKQANLLMMNLSDYREIGRQFGINHVGMVIRNGNIVYNRTSWKAGAR